MDYNAELERLGKEKKKLESEVARGEKKLGNEGFVAKAPENVIAMEREKLTNYREMLAKVTERLTIVEKKLGK
jgi:valyl-tRNA synthetase